MAADAWSRKTYERSVSSRCWWYTPYDGGWDQSDLGGDEELRQIVEMERALGEVPAWAQAIVAGAMRYVPPCGHCHFPLAYLEIVSAIGGEAAPGFIHSCYTIARARKEQMTDYLLCLDAWLADADPTRAAAEVSARSARQVDWPAVSASLWEVLGERTETKELLVERVLHRQR